MEHYEHVEEERIQLHPIETHKKNHTLHSHGTLQKNRLLAFHMILVVHVMDFFEP